MDTIAVEAVSQLKENIEELLPTLAEPDVDRWVAVHPLSIKPSGMGGIIGIHQEPYGDIVGRTVEASLTIAFRSENVAHLIDAQSSITSKFSSLSRQTLRQYGLLKINMNALTDRSTHVTQNGDIVNEQDMLYTVLFEYQKIPSEVSEVITDIPLHSHVVTGSYTKIQMHTIDFEKDPLEEFAIVDDPKCNRQVPSAWFYDADEMAVRQTRKTRGGSLATNANKPGTYLLFTGFKAKPYTADMIIESTMRSNERNGIGMVFRFIDPDNFYYFLMSDRNSFRLLGKKVNGTFSHLETPAVDTTNGYITGQLYIVRLECKESEFKVYLDETLVLQGHDKAINQAGKNGLLCHGNKKAFFYSYRTIQFIK